MTQSYLHDTRTSYDTVAADYAEIVRDGGPWERATLARFAELVQQGGSGPVLDVGCGPGRVTALLHELGLQASGVDLSPGMVEVARRDHPGLTFAVGSMTDLDLPDAGLGGLIAWWSIVHLPPEVLPVAFAEFHRVLAPGGELLLGFHVGDERRHKKSGYGGHPMSLDVYLLPPDRIAELATAAGLIAHTRLITDLEAAVPQACLFFRKPAAIQ
ncbi:class I SAM-dependent methyltransferase [Kribbella alba]|uniref:Class I SAM-dependent methyltransferase n=1 Tax=Kribbella alba TaxID=190197 RepID=A0ABN2FAQ1_9ACTN